MLTHKAALFQHLNNRGKQYDVVPDRTVRDMDLNDELDATLFKKVCGKKLGR